MQSQLSEGIELKIEKIVPGGYGIARTEAGTFFARYVIPGEIIRAKKWEKKKGVYFVTNYEIIKPGPIRIEPRCRYFTLCGGCSFQMGSYDTQIDWKKQILTDSFQRIGSVKDFSEKDIKEVIKGEEWEYRYRARFQVRDGIAGFFKAGSNMIVAVKECPIVRTSVNNAYTAVSKLISESKATEFIKTLRAFEVKVNLNENACSVVFIAGSGSGAKSFIRQLSAKLEEIFDTVSLSVSYSKTELPGKGYRLLYGAERIFSQYRQLSFGFSPLSFFQPNLRLAIKTYEKIADLLKQRGARKVIDFYSGSGVLDLFLADDFEVLGIEVSPFSHEDAIQNAFINEKKVEFLNLDVSLVENIEAADTVILNPPRSGAADNLIQAIGKQQQVKTVIYLSCEPSTLMRDLKLFRQHEFYLEETTLIDFYPQTHHLETLVVLGR